MYKRQLYAGPYTKETDKAPADGRPAGKGHAKHKARLACNNKKAGKLPEDGKNIDYMLK